MFVKSNLCLKKRFCCLDFGQFTWIYLHCLQQKACLFLYFVLNPILTRFDWVVIDCILNQDNYKVLSTWILFLDEKETSILKWKFFRLCLSYRIYYNSSSQCQISNSFGCWNTNHNQKQHHMPIKPLNLNVLSLAWLIACTAWLLCCS